MPLTLPRAAPALHDIYDPDDVGPPDAEELEPMKYTLVPSPSPEPDAPPPPASPDSSPGPDERSGLPRSPSRPSRGDAVLIAFMAGGKYHDVARDAGETPLAAEGEEAGDVPGPAAPPGRAIGGAPAVEERRPQRGGLDWATMAAMQTLAADALRQAARRSPRPAPDGAPPRSPQPRTERAGAGAREGQVATAVPAIPSRAGDGPASAAQMAPDGIPDLGASPVGELPPIRPSPRATLSHGAAHGQITLPSISAQLGHFEQFADAGEPVYATSPPGRPPQRFAVAPCHGSSPQSPSDVFRALPSPSKNHFYPTYTKSHRRSSHGHDGFPHYPSPTEYPGGSSSSTETPGSGTDGSGPSPATVGIDRMSIDGITNPQIGGFQCTHPGCTAPPFQTQYLLNSHTNVHSQNRPHYCSVKGCPRSEGGKGFKRKNEMIRHGLVHDSPGYVCPFCPDREHKYPRPDNLQRHVRVHHVDKDKDDALLRDVLSQRPEGPSRGRRRRGVTS